MIKSTALAHMSIPQKAVLASTTKELVTTKEYSSSSPKSFTGIIAINTGAIFGTPLVVAAPIIFPEFMFLHGIGIALTIVSYVVTLVALMGLAIESGRTKEFFSHVANQKVEVAQNPWNYKKGFYKPNAGVSYYNRYEQNDARSEEVISLKSRKSTIWTYVNPLRLFKKVLLSETIRYNIHDDVYTRTRHYLGAFRYTKAVEHFQGPRKAFQKTLSAIESGK